MSATTITPSPLGPSLSPRAAGPGPDEMGQRFARRLRRARRHSRLVSVLKIGLPGLALLGVVGFGAAAAVTSAVPDGFSLETLSVEDGELVMTNPRLVGFDERQQPYSLDAQRATQNVADPDRFELEEVLAEIPLADGRRITVLSRGGAYDRGADRLTIPDPFTVMIDDGTVGEFARGDVDVAAGTLMTDGPVDIRRPDARIQARSLSVERGGRTATFEGDVRVTIEPGSSMAPPTMRSTSVAEPDIRTVPVPRGRPPVTSGETRLRLE